jgi:hypothetical protein
MTKDTSGTETDAVPIEFSDYYDLLDVGESASTDDINRAYREKIKEYHPDRGGGGCENPEQVIHVLQEARDTLTSEGKRRAYDVQGHEKYTSPGGAAERDLDSYVEQSRTQEDIKTESGSVGVESKRGAYSTVTDTASMFASTRTELLNQQLKAILLVTVVGSLSAAVLLTLNPFFGLSIPAGLSAFLSLTLLAACAVFGPILLYAYAKSIDVPDDYEPTAYNLDEWANHRRYLLLIAVAFGTAFVAGDGTSPVALLQTSITGGDPTGYRPFLALESAGAPELLGWLNVVIGIAFILTVLRTAIGLLDAYLVMFWRAGIQQANNLGVLGLLSATIGGGFMLFGALTGGLNVANGQVVTDVGLGVSEALSMPMTGTTLFIAGCSAYLGLSVAPTTVPVPADDD